MKRMLLIGCWWTTVVLAAAENFSKAVRPEDFSAAGLGKLSPEELARLDALVSAFQRGAAPGSSAVATRPAGSDSREEWAARLAIAQHEAAIAEAARAAAEAKATKAEADANARLAQAETAKEKKSEPGLLAKAKVRLTPGTEVEYASTDSRIAGDFTGWEGRPIFQLENGQRWQLANDGSYYTPAIHSPRVQITPASLGGFWMTIEGVSQRVRVNLVGGGK